MGTKAVLSSRKKTLIEIMFDKHGYEDQDIEDFFVLSRMDRRFAQELKDIRAERARLKVLEHLQPATD
jgi:hypothetical protein